MGNCSETTPSLIEQNTFFLVTLVTWIIMVFSQIILRRPEVWTNTGVSSNQFTTGWAVWAAVIRVTGTGLWVASGTVGGRWLAQAEEHAQRCTTLNNIRKYLLGNNRHLHWKFYQLQHWKSLRIRKQQLYFFLPSINVKAYLLLTKVSIERKTSLALNNNCLQKLNFSRLKIWN